MKKIFGIVSVLICLIAISMPNLVALLGVSTYAAKKIVDAIMAAMSIWSIIGLLAVSGGSAAVAFLIAKSAIKKFGRKIAATY